MTNSSQNMENLLLMSLIDDLDSSTKPYAPTSKFQNFQKCFDLSKSNCPSLTNSSSKSNEDSSSQPDPNIEPIIKRSDILSSLSNQKIAIFLQSAIREMSISEITSFINEIKGSFSFIMNDKNGNYLCSDLFKSCTPFQRAEILKEIFKEFDVIAVNEYGTHAVQTLIELSKTKEEYFLISSSLCEQKKILNVALNPNGAYVIQKIIVNIPEMYRQKFNLFLLSIIPLLSCDMYGVCSAKKFIAFTQSDYMTLEIIQMITRNILPIAKNQYGNYLIQHILEIWWNKKELFYFKQVITQLFYQFSSNQYASHISEVYIKMLDNEEKKNLLNMLIKNGSYSYLLKDKYGIFVMKRLNLPNNKKNKM